MGFEPIYPGKIDSDAETVEGEEINLNDSLSSSTVITFKELPLAKKIPISDKPEHGKGLKT